MADDRIPKLELVTRRASAPRTQIAPPPAARPAASSAPGPRRRPPVTRPDSWEPLYDDDEPRARRDHGENLRRLNSQIERDLQGPPARPRFGTLAMVVVMAVLGAVPLAFLHLSSGGGEAATPLHLSVPSGAGGGRLPGIYQQVQTDLRQGQSATQP